MYRSIIVGSIRFNIWNQFSRRSNPSLGALFRQLMSAIQIEIIRNIEVSNLRYRCGPSDKKEHHMKIMKAISQP